MRVSHPDEATLLRSIVGELPERRQADLKRHLTRCRPCLEESAATKRLHERLSAAGDSLAFSPGDPFTGRPVPWIVGAAPELAARAMAIALGGLGREKELLLATIEVEPVEAARALDLDDPACRLAAAHVLEEAVAADPSGRLAEFADAIARREGACGREAEAVLPGAHLRALAHIVVGNWRLFTGSHEDSADEFRGAWSALGACEAPEHLCAWVEVGESLRRSYEGRVVEGRLLAERALETFERYGLARGLVRARQARAVALYMAREFREAHRMFRAAIESKDATGLDRARGVSGAAFCLAARGRFHEAAKEYSRVRRRLRGEGAMVEQYLLQGEMKAVLGTAGRWHVRRDRLATFALPEADGAFHARETAGEIVRAVSEAEDKEDGLEKARELLGKIESDPSRVYAYLYACQLAMPKVAGDPAMYVAFAKGIADATRNLPYLRDMGPAQPVCREQALGEASLLESNAQNVLGEPGEARTAAQRARVSLLEAGEDSFTLALADYFEGSAASFESDSSPAWNLLRGAHSEFRLYGQENWQGRAEAAIGTLLQNRDSLSSALGLFDRALRSLHPERDGAAFASTLANLGYVFVRLCRLDAAKATYAKALLIARRLEMRVTLLIIRYGLASIDLQKGNLFRALGAFERLSTDAEGIAQRILSADLRIAECLGRMGRNAEMVERVERLRASADVASVESDPALRELFASVEERSVNHELLAHVARFAEARDRGVRAAYKPFRLVAKR